MTWNIIGCGETAAAWDGHGLSIGVNDCEKYGKKVAALVLVNPPHEFSDVRRLQILRTSAIVYSDDYSGGQWDREWRKLTRDNSGCKFATRRLVLSPWRGAIPPCNSRACRERIYHADTSPFVAMSLAHAWGAKEIILWGVDFQTHGKFKAGAPYFANEIRKYVEFNRSVVKKGVRVWLGTHGSALEPMIAVKPR